MEQLKEPIVTLLIVKFTKVLFKEALQNTSLNEIVLEHVLLLSLVSISKLSRAVIYGHMK